MPFILLFTHTPELKLLLLVPRLTAISKFPTNACHVCAGILTAPLLLCLMCARQPLFPDSFSSWEGTAGWI